MLCESCGEMEANVYLTHIVADVAKKIHLCEECAAKSGINVQGCVSLPDFLMGMGSLDENDASSASPKICASCQMRLSDFKKTSRLGCPVCYDTFGPELNHMIASMQKGSKHVGGAPSKATGDSGVDPRIEILHRALEQAVSSENYEDAARLRDEICLEKAKGELGKRAARDE